LEEQLSLMELVLNASFTVQLVMAILLLASMLSWYMIVQRFIYFRNARDEMYGFEERFWSGIDLAQLYREGNEKASDGHNILGMESISGPASRSSPGLRNSRVWILKLSWRAHAGPCGWR
jgi:biopolymer transport protein TolQ